MQPLVFLRARLHSQGLQHPPARKRSATRLARDVFLLSLKRFPTKYPVFSTVTRNAQAQLNHHVRAKDVDLRDSSEP
jgi:hypothetical protein